MLKQTPAPKTGQDQKTTPQPAPAHKTTPGQRRRNPLDNYREPEHVWDQTSPGEIPDEAIPEIADNTEEEDNPIVTIGEAEKPSVFQPATPCLRNRYIPLWIWTGEHLIWATERPGVNPVESETLRKGLETLIRELHHDGLPKDFGILKGFVHRDWIDRPAPTDTEDSSTGDRQRTGNVAWLNRLDKRTIVDLESGDRIPIGSLFAGEGLRKGDVPDNLRTTWLDKITCDKGYPGPTDLKWNQLNQWLPDETKAFLALLTKRIKTAFPHTGQTEFTCPKDSTMQRKWISELRQRRKGENPS